MGYSGLIYAAIVAAWAAFLVPRWVRRNEEVERAREVDQVRGVRVLSRRAGPPQAPHGSVTLPPPAPSSTAVSAPAPAPAAASVSVSAAAASSVSAAAPSPASVVAPSDDAFIAAARRRRRMLAILLVLLVASVALAVVGRAPALAPAGPAVLLVLFLFLARRAAVAQARRRRVEARRRAASRRPAERQEGGVVWASVTEPPVAEEGAPRRLVLPDEIAAEAPAEDPNAWSPVSVPLPTYLTKPKATRPAARKIDLGQPGAWTSGRLDPASSIQLPHRAPDERPAASAEPAATAESEESIQQPRRAVGD